MYVLYVYTVYKIGQTNCQLSCFKYCTVNQGLNGGKHTAGGQRKQERGKRAQRFHSY